MKQEINVLKNDIYRDIYSFSTKRWILVIFRTFKVVSYDAIFVAMNANIFEHNILFRYILF